MDRDEWLSAYQSMMKTDTMKQLEWRRGLMLVKIRGRSKPWSGLPWIDRLEAIDREIDRRSRSNPDSVVTDVANLIWQARDQQ